MWENVGHWLSVAAQIMGIPAAIAGFLTILMRWGETMAPYKRRIGGALICIGIVLYGFDVANRLGYWGVETFKSEFPDAIMCEGDFSGYIGQSSFVFYFSSVTDGRKYFGRVIRYTYPIHGHEVWFDTDGNMLIPNEDKSALEAGKKKYSKADLDEYEVAYIDSFLAHTNCGGQNIEEVRRSKRAFSFARRM